MKKQLLLAICCAFGAMLVQAQDYIINASGMSFAPNNLTIEVGETVQWQNTSGFHNVNGTTATFPGNPQGFGSGGAANAPWNFSFTFTIPGTYQYRCDIHFSMGMTGTITVEEPAGGYPTYDIATVTSVDTDGVADSLGVVCELQGIVYGVDLRGGSGVQFVMRDNTGGIVVFGAGINYYPVTEGDEIVVRGAIEQFNGLTEIAPDTIILVSTGNALENPVVITSLGESAESELVRINDVSIVTPSQWTNSGPGFNVDISDGVNTYQMRIDNDTDLYGTTAPTGTFDVVGLGWQFDNASPYDAGYQLYPRYTDDIIGGIINPIQYPPYPIGTVTTVDGNGDLDSLNVKCQIQGIVHSGDMNGGGSIQFFLIDDTGGISVFSADDFGYTVAEGDELVVRGTIVTFNCLSQITPDTLWVESSGNTLFDPELVIGDMTEDHESEILQFNNLSLVDPGDWTGAGAGFNVEVTDGVNTYQMRIDNDVDLYSLPAPVGTFNAIGLGSQFDSDGTCSDGYQFLPRSLEDIISTGVDDRSTDLRVKVFPNPAGQLLSVQTELPVERWMVSDMNGKQLMQWEANGVHALDISRLEPGVYVLQGLVDGALVSKRFIVK